MSEPDDRDAEISAIAYRLWEEEGRPEGQDARHWDAAKEIWASAPERGSARPPATSRAPAGGPDEPAYAGIPEGEPVLALENQAIPTALGDQEGVTRPPRRGGGRAAGRTGRG